MSGDARDEAQALLQQAVRGPFDLLRMGPAHLHARVVRRG